MKDDGGGLCPQFSTVPVPVHRIPRSTLDHDRNFSFKEGRDTNTHQDLMYGVQRKNRINVIFPLRRDPGSRTDTTFWFGFRVRVRRLSVSLRGHRLSFGVGLTPDQESVVEPPRVSLHRSSVRRRRRNKKKNKGPGLLVICWKEFIMSWTLSRTHSRTPLPRPSTTVHPSPAAGPEDVWCRGWPDGRFPVLR